MPSTVYRTLDVLEDLGCVSHGHGVDGREEYHVLPDRRARPPPLPGCGGSWEIETGPRPTRSPACSRRSGRSRSTAPTSRSPGSVPGARTQRKWRAPDRVGRTGHGSAEAIAGIVDGGRTSSMRTGDPPPGANRGSTATANPRRVRQLTSQAKRACLEVRGVPAVARVLHRRSARSGATCRSTWSRPSASAERGARHHAAPDHRPAGGLEPLGLAALAAAPFIANLLSAFAGRVGPRSARQLALVRGVGAASLAALLILPTAPVMIAVAVIFWISLSFGSPFHLRLWGAMYPAGLARPDRRRGGHRPGRGRRDRRVVGGIVADRSAAPTAVAFAGIVGAVCAIGCAGFRARRRPNARGLLRPRLDRARCATARSSGGSRLAQGFYGGGLIAASRSTPSYTSTASPVHGRQSGSSASWGPGRRRCPSSRGASSADRLGPLVAMSVGTACGTRLARRGRVRTRRRRAVDRGRRGWCGQRLDRRRDRRGRQRPHAARPRARPRWPAGTRSPALAGSRPRS